MRKKVLSTLSLVMINVAAIGSIKNWPLIAEYGFASMFFYLLAALIFFFPVSLVSAELATGWPKAGGIYNWVKEAFGHRTGFLAIWLLWIENVFWYPTVLSFIAATLAYIFKPELAENGTYMALTILTLFWGSTLLNLRGIRVSSWISSIGATLGTFIPASLIIGFALYWVVSGHGSAIPFSARALLPDLTHFDQIAFFTGILLSLAGMEMSAIHAGDVRNPQKDYPRAILFSALAILGFSIAGVLSSQSSYQKRRSALSPARSRPSLGCSRPSASKASSPSWLSSSQSARSAPLRLGHLALHEAFSKRQKMGISLPSSAK